jgi:hypothetical protein
MEKKELSQQRLDGESRRLEYKSPTLRKLGKLTDLTLQVSNQGPGDGPSGQNKKTS